ncbi:hypothetical protein DPMN_158302 [Dreissena polymorpha]|uniref:Uncharacterized protein n=1 Tax=Dreissena polymorpha TaxID=45954 RepID=A0A9D4ILV3_DREPO|nr:hypothetical protein DPMN_158302 [Dreissena polymorpha]
MRLHAKFVNVGSIGFVELVSSERPVQEQGPAVKHSCIHPQGREAEAVATCVRTDVAENGGRGTAVLRAIRDRVPNLSVENIVLDFEKVCVAESAELGLATAYRNNQAIHQYVRQLMALPFLPAGHITETFHQLQARANSVQLTQLVDYVNRQWINNAIFRHHRLNSQAHHGAVPFYVLVPALRKEAEMVDIIVQSSDLERRTDPDSNLTTS